MSIPEELARREERLRRLAEARAKIEARAEERFAREQAEHEAKLAARDAKTKATGKKPGGKQPAPPSRPWPIAWRHRQADALRPAQTNARAGIRHHQIGAGFPSILVTRTG
jgi:hypothetical protein